MKNIIYIYFVAIFCLHTQLSLATPIDTLQSDYDPLALQHSFDGNTTDPDCEICGCGAGGYYLGVMPMINRGFAGLRYQTQSFDSHLTFRESERTKETFNTLELWARFYPADRVQIFALVPYSFNTQETVYRTKKINGVGDISILANYNVTNNNTDTTQKDWKYSIWAGGGVKLPTGKHTYDEVDLTQVANPNFQLGTGSLDFVMNMLCTLKHKSWGLSLDANYKINGTNNDQYRFGNKLSGTLSVFYIQELFKKSGGIIGSTGIYTESAQVSSQGNRKIDRTGGAFTSHNIGLDAYYRSIVIGYSFQNPIAQDLAKGEINAHARQLMHFTFMF